MSKEKSDSVATTRRKFLTQSVGSGVALGAAWSVANAIDSGDQALPDGVESSIGHGKYKVVPLRSDIVTVGMMQTPVLPPDAKNPGPDIKSNLRMVLDSIDKAQYYGGKKDLLVFHEFAITGWASWTRSELLRIALEIPGPETEALGAKAREHNCYITFGTYARDKDWPNHIISMSVVINPKGEIVSRQWKARNIHGKFVGFELFTSSVYDVLDRYVEMYGWDEVIPVARTDVGNICISPCVLEPELYRAMALKGGEFLVRVASGGGAATTPDMQNVCAVNGVYGGMVSNAASPQSRYFLEGATAGNSSRIWSPEGRVIAESLGDGVECVVARIPMAEYRRRHRTPEVAWPLYSRVPKDVRFDPGAFLEHLPETLEESGEYFKKRAKW